MKIKLKTKLLIFIVVLIAISAFLVSNGLWRTMLSNSQVWEIIEKGDAYPVYEDAATSYFGSAEIASDTYRDWATSQWKSQQTLKITEQRFLTNGIVFVIKQEGDEWILESMISKEGGTIEIK